MRRREFVAATLATRTAAKAAGKPIPRRTYKAGVELSIIGFGGIVVVGQPQEAANREVAAAFERGVNYFDVAPTYADGEAETKLGVALEPYRKNAFLACKTTMRDRDGARKELERSLGRLKTDYFDLYQFHGVSKMEEVEQILAPGGAAETFLKARDEGKVRFLGCSAHSVECALALLERFPLDSVLFPTNFVCFAQGNFGPQVIARAKQKGVARLALKAMAYTPWPKGVKEHDFAKCWYRPVSDPALARQALRFTLSEDITAAIPPGDERLFRMALDIAAGFKPLTARERTQLLARTQGTEPIFRASA